MVIRDLEDHSSAWSTFKLTSQVKTSSEPSRFKTVIFVCIRTLFSCRKFTLSEIFSLVNFHCRLDLQKYFNTELFPIYGICGEACASKVTLVLICAAVGSICTRLGRTKKVPCSDIHNGADKVPIHWGLLGYILALGNFHLQLHHESWSVLPPPAISPSQWQHQVHSEGTTRLWPSVQAAITCWPPSSPTSKQPSIPAVRLL